MAKLAFNRGFYNRACEWAETALWRAKEDNASAARLPDMLFSFSKTNKI